MVRVFIDDPIKRFTDGEEEIQLPDEVKIRFEFKDFTIWITALKEEEEIVLGKTGNLSDALRIQPNASNKITIT